MINNIAIKNIATFKADEQKVESLKSFNYFFGANGTGKTTISNIIASAADLTIAPFVDCALKWENDNPLEVRVYNRKFVDYNFEGDPRGVFTLGDESIGIKKEIKEKAEKATLIQKEMDALQLSLTGEDGSGGKKKDIEEHEETYRRKFWEQKLKADKSTILKGMQGVLNSQQKFKEKVLEEAENTEELFTLGELEEKATTVFDDSLTEVREFSIPDISKIELLEVDSILKKIVVGKSDVDIAAMIKILNNSDWVRQGKLFFETNNGTCPFCQQKTTDDFSQSLEAYFDVTFEENTLKIATLISNYSAYSVEISEAIQSILDNTSAGKFIDIKLLEAKKMAFEALAEKNKQMLDKKRKEASQVIELDYTKTILTKIIEVIIAANKKINENNLIAKNIQEEKVILSKQIWRYIVSELKADITEYKTKKQEIEAAIIDLNKQMADKRTEKIVIENAIGDLEKKK